MSGRRSNSLRIIGGEHRGRRLHFIAPQGLRPTTDRVRETLFNWLQARISGARVLDLFAGSGALGFEASSRGAAEVVMVESGRKVAEMLRDNAGLIATPGRAISIINRDARHYLQSSAEPFDIVFLDPPFRQDLMQPVIDALVSANWLAENALIYLEQGSEEPLPVLPPGWHILREKQAGQVRYQLIASSISESQ